MSNRIIELLRQTIDLDVSKVSPSFYMRWLGGTLKSAEEGHISYAFTVREDMCNPSKRLHGGVISGMLDEVAGVAVFSLARKNFFTTVNLNVDYLLPANLGDEVIVTAKVIRAGKRIIHVEMYMKLDERIIAKATSNLIKLDTEVPKNLEFYD